MRILFTIPHYFGPSQPDSQQPGRHGSQSSHASRRADALSQCIGSLHQLFGQSQSIINIAKREVAPVNQATAAEIHVVVCTAPDRHLLSELCVDDSLYHHFVSDGDPLMLGFQCHTTLRDRWGNFDFYCFLEDDLIIRDPGLFTKLDWFSRHVGQDKLLQPNRFERGHADRHHKVYLDGDLRPDVTASFQDVSIEPRLGSDVFDQRVEFSRTLNPHSGCFFLNAEQMQHWINQPFFLDRDTSFVGPLESAASLGIMRTFKVYKPILKNASFLEIEHHGTQFLNLIRPV